MKQKVTFPLDGCRGRWTVIQEARDCFTRVAVIRGLNGRAAITPEFAIRLDLWFGKERGGDATAWLSQQFA